MGQGMFTFPQAPDRARALGEIHARPYVLVTAPRVIFQLAFMMDGGAGVDHAVMAEMSHQRGVSPPGRDARHHVIPWVPALYAGSSIPSSQLGSGMAHYRKNSVGRCPYTPSATASVHRGP